MSQTDEININDTRIASELESNGYTVIPALGADSIGEFMESIYERIRDNNPGKLNFNTGADMKGPVRLITIDMVKAAATPVLGRYFSNYEIVFGIMFVKRASPDIKAQVGLHFDPTLLRDESKQKHFNAWIPLIDVDEQNGAMWVIPGSHKIFPPVNAITIPFPFSKIQEKVYEYGKCIRMKAGEALIWDNRLIHYSLQNFSNNDRPSVVLTFVPPEAEFISLFRAQGADSPIEVYQQSRNWYYDPSWSNDFGPPRIGKLLGHLNYEPFFVTERKFVEHLESGEPLKNYTFELRM